MGTAESPRLLKAKDARQIGTSAAFNYEDIRRKCDEHIESVRRQAREILEAAQQEGEAMRQRSREEGFQEGRRQGLMQADEEISKRAAEQAEQIATDKLKTTLPAMHAAVDALTLGRDRWLAQWETAAIRLSVAVAEKLVRHELSINPHVGKEMISAVLQLAAGSPHIKLRLHPDDRERLGPYAEEVVAHLSACGEAQLIPDDSISPGGCVVDTQHGTIDARVETQLERIASELLQHEQ